jgi:hypothetical protein
MVRKDSEGIRSEKPIRGDVRTYRSNTGFDAKQTREADPGAALSWLRDTTQPIPKTCATPAKPSHAGAILTSPSFLDQNQR